MKSFKALIFGQIALIVVGLCPFRAKMSKSERKDYEVLKQCLELLKDDNPPEVGVTIENALLNK